MMKAPKPISDIIVKSGNAFHSRVAQWFANQGWHITISPYYMDTVQNKAREIDLLAEKHFPIHPRMGAIDKCLVVRLFIECKYFPGHAVFWMDNRDSVRAKEKLCAKGPFRTNNMHTDEHHYLSSDPRVAKLFATDKPKEVESEPIYKALNQTLNALVSMDRRDISIPGLKAKGLRPAKVITYPLIICNSFDNFFSVDFYDNSAVGKIVDNFQLEVQYAYVDRSGQAREDYFLIDIADFDNLHKIESDINKDADIALFFMA